MARLGGALTMLAGLALLWVVVSRAPGRHPLGEGALPVDAGAAASRAAVGLTAGASPTLTAAELLAGHSQDWRLAWLQDNPQVLVIEFPNLKEQGAAMNRLAAFLQKAGAPRDRVLNDTELAAVIRRQGDNSQTFFQGHDYAESDLQQFFAQAARQQLALMPQERRLRQVLQQEGLLGDAPASKASSAAAAAARAVVSFTATQPDDPSTPEDESVDAVRREAILRHELSHGRFYTEPLYRAHCFVLWREMLTPRQRERLLQHLAELGYDTTHESLVVNEAQAFLLHTPDVRAFSAHQAAMADAELEAVRAQFWQSLPGQAARPGR